MTALEEQLTRALRRLSAQPAGEVNRGRESYKSTGTIHDDRKRICEHDLRLIVTNHVSLPIRKNEPDSTGSNGIAADQRTKLRVRKGNEAKSQPDDPPPPMSGFCGPSATPPTWSVPATDSRVVPGPPSRCRAAGAGRLAVRLSARFQDDRSLA